MKFTCKTLKLKEVINKVERIVSKQITLPVLANVLISTEKGRISISATNLEIAIKTFIGGKVEAEGQITVPARIMGGFLANIKDEVVNAELKGSELVIYTDEHKMKIKGMDAKDFPVIPPMPKNNFFTVKGGGMDKIIPGILISVAHNDTRQELNGVFVKFEKDQLVLASTDSFRLSEAIIPLSDKKTKEEYFNFMDKNPSIIIPALAIGEVLRNSHEGDFDFSIDQNQLFIKSNEFRIISRLINGNYPEYRQVLPKKYEIELKVDKEQLLNAIRIAALVANSQNSEIKISSSEDNKYLVISSESLDVGDNISKIEAQINGPGFEVIFNYRYISEGLAVFPTENRKIIMKLNQQKSPVLLRSVDLNGNEDKNLSYVVMPIIKS